MEVHRDGFQDVKVFGTLSLIFFLFPIVYYYLVLLSSWVLPILVSSLQAHFSLLELFFLSYWLNLILSIIIFQYVYQKRQGKKVDFDRLQVIMQDSMEEMDDLEDVGKGPHPLEKGPHPLEKGPHPLEKGPHPLEKRLFEVVSLESDDQISDRVDKNFKIHIEITDLSADQLNETIGHLNNAYNDFNAFDREEDSRMILTDALSQIDRQIDQQIELFQHRFEDPLPELLISLDLSNGRYLVSQIEFLIYFLDIHKLTPLIGNLNLKGNRLKRIPANLDFMKNLQISSFEENKLRFFPQSILETLPNAVFYLKGNRRLLPFVKKYQAKMIEKGEKIRLFTEN